MKAAKLITLNTSTENIDIRQVEKPDLISEKQILVEVYTAGVNPIDWKIRKGYVALPLAGVSALQGITEHINLQKGQKILIHGGAGGIGHIAIQIAKGIGAYIATTVRKAHIDFVKDLGAQETIDYSSQMLQLYV